jgi:hypothetical protein
VLSSIYLNSITYLLEMVPKKSQNFMSYLFILSENVIPVAIGSSYFFLGGKHWTSPFIISLVLPIVGFALLLFVPKSPVYQLEKGNIVQAEKELRAIAKFNGKSLPYEFQIYTPEVQVECEEGLMAKKKKLLTTCSYFSRLILTIMISIHANANQVMWGFYIKNLDINIFLVNLVDCLTSSIFIICTYFILKTQYIRPVIMGILVISLI